MLQIQENCRLIASISIEVCQWRSNGPLGLLLLPAESNLSGVTMFML